MLIETQREDGSTAQIVYVQGGAIDAVALENLCTKVGSAGQGAE